MIYIILSSLSIKIVRLLNNLTHPNKKLKLLSQKFYLLKHRDS